MYTYILYIYILRWVYKRKTFFWTSFHFFWTWALLMDLTTILLEMATLLVDFLHSLGFNISTILTRKCSAPLLVTNRVSSLLPILPSSSFFDFYIFYSSHLFQPFTYTGESAPLEGIHLVSMSKLPPPLCLSVPAFIHLVSRLPLWPLDNFLHASWFEFAFGVSAPPLSLNNPLRSSGFNT